MEGTHAVGRQPFMPDSTLSRRSAALHARLAKYPSGNHKIIPRIPLKCLKWAGSRGRHFHFPSTWCQIISPPWSSKGGVASCLGTFATVLGEGGMGVEEGDGLGEEGASFGSGVTHRDRVQ